MLFEPPLRRLRLAAVLAVAALLSCARPSIEIDIDPAPARDGAGGTTHAGALPGGSPAPPPSETPRGDDPAGEDPAAEPCSGVRGPGDHVHSVTVDGRARTFLVHVPPNADHALPVVIVWHALLLTGTTPALLPSIRELTGFDKHADQRGFVTVYPEGTNKSWNAGECCGDGKRKNVDDVGFARRILEEIPQDACVDASRVYSTGFSNGGFLSHRLACELGDRFAAIASVAGTLGVPAASCTPNAPIAVLQIHGTDDPLVPYEGGSPEIPLGGIFGTFASVDFTIAHWEARNACAGPVTPVLQRGGVTCSTRACALGTEVENCKVEGGGHQWPGSAPLPGMGPQTSDIDATSVVVEFLLSHAR